MTIFGESHGEGVGMVLDGCPAGSAFECGRFYCMILKEEKAGYGKGPHQVRNLICRFLKAVYLNDHTTGPIPFLFENNNTVQEIMKN